MSPLLLAVLVSSAVAAQPAGPAAPSWSEGSLSMGMGVLAAGGPAEVPMVGLAASVVEPVGALAVRAGASVHAASQLCLSRSCPAPPSVAEGHIAAGRFWGAGPFRGAATAGPAVALVTRDGVSALDVGVAGAVQALAPDGPLGVGAELNGLLTTRGLAVGGRVLLVLRSRAD